MTNQRILLFVPVLFVLLWSTGFIGAKYAMPYAEPFTLLSLRMAISALFILAMATYFRPTWPDRAGAMHSMIVGVLVHAGYLGGVFAAIKQGLPAGTTALIVGMQPLLTAILAWLWINETVNRRQILGLMLGLLGISLVLYFRDPTQFSQSVNPITYAYATIAVVTISVGTLYQKRFCSQVSLIAGTFYQYLATALLLGVLALFFETREIHWNTQLILALIWLVLVLSLAAIFLLMLMIRNGKATTVASYFYLTPPLTALLSWVLFDETLSPLALLGIAIASAGVYLARAR